MSITDVKEAIKTTTQTNAAIKKLVPHDASIKLHAGKFTWQELTERSFTAPAIFISHLGFESAPEQIAYAFSDPDNVMNVRFAVGVVAKHAKGAEARNKLGNAITELFALQLTDRQTWGLNDVEVPTRIKAQGLYNPEAEADGQSMWLITWYQALQLSQVDWSALLDEFQGVDADHYHPDKTPGVDDIDAETTIDLPEVSQ